MALGIPSESWMVVRVGDDVMVVMVTAGVFLGKLEKQFSSIFKAGGSNKRRSVI